MPPSASSRLRAQQHSTSLILIPLLFLASFVIMLPGVWAVGLMAGMDVPGAEKKNASTMALLMLLSWPVALALFAAAIIKLKSLKKR